MPRNVAAGLPHGRRPSEGVSLHSKGFLLNSAGMDGMAYGTGGCAGGVVAATTEQQPQQPGQPFQSLASRPPSSLGRSTLGHARSLSSNSRIAQQPPPPLPYPHPLPIAQHQLLLTPSCSTSLPQECKPQQLQPDLVAPPPQPAPSHSSNPPLLQYSQPSQSHGSLLMAGPGSLCACLPRYVRHPPLEAVVFGWGVSEDGQLGLDSLVDVAAPKVVERLLGVQFSGRSFCRTPLVAGSRNTLAIDAAGQVWSFGWNDRGTLGHGHRSLERKPQRIAALRGIRVVQVAIGGWHCLALSDRGTMFAWGGNEYGQCGNVEGLVPGQRDIVGPMPVDLGLGPSLRVRQVAAGGMHSLALLDDGTVWQWGENWGDFSMHPLRIPRPVPGAVGVAAVCCGAFHNLLLTAGGRVFSWGMNDYGQLGNGSTTYATAPRPVLDMDGVVVADIAAGGWHSCALSSAGEVWVWGRGEYGRLGLGDRSGSSKLRPQKVRGLESHVVVQVAAGGSHTMALTSTARLFVWGRGAFGRLGLADPPRDCYHPVEACLPGGTERWRVAAISAGGRHSICLAIPVRDPSNPLGDGFGAGAESPLAHHPTLHGGLGSSDDFEADRFREPSLYNRDRYFECPPSGVAAAAVEQQLSLLQPDSAAQDAEPPSWPSTTFVTNNSAAASTAAASDGNDEGNGGGSTSSADPVQQPAVAGAALTVPASEPHAAANVTPSGCNVAGGLLSVLTSNSNRNNGSSYGGSNGGSNGGGGGTSGGCLTSSLARGGGLAPLPPPPTQMSFGVHVRSSSPSSASLNTDFASPLLPQTIAAAAVLDADSDMAPPAPRGYCAAAVFASAAAGSRPGSAQGSINNGNGNGSSRGGSGTGMTRVGFRPVFGGGGEEEDEAVQAAEAAEAAAEVAGDDGDSGADNSGDDLLEAELGDGQDDTDEDHGLYESAGGIPRPRSPSLLPRPRSPSVPLSPRRLPSFNTAPVTAAVGVTTAAPRAPSPSIAVMVAGGIGSGTGTVLGSPSSRTLLASYGSPRRPSSSELQDSLNLG